MKRLWKYVLPLASTFLISCQGVNNNNFIQMPVQDFTQNTVVNTFNSNDSIFPLNPNYVWQYDVVYHPQNDPYVDFKGTYTVKVENIKKNANNTVLTLRGIDTLSNRYHFPEFVITPDSVKMNNVDFYGFGASYIEGMNIDFLSLPLKQGNKWDDGNWIGKVKNIETVKVPAGEFKAWKIDVIGTYDHQYTAVGYYWFTPGVGIVKSELSIPGLTVESDLILATDQRNIRK